MTDSLPLLPVRNLPRLSKKKSINSAKTPHKTRRKRKPKPPARTFQERPGNPAANAQYWHGKTLGEICRASGVHLSTVSRVYNRIRRPTFDVGCAIASALGITMDQLYLELRSDSKGRIRLPKGFVSDTDVQAVPIE